MVLPMYLNYINTTLWYALYYAILHHALISARSYVPHEVTLFSVSAHGFARQCFSLVVFWEFKCHVLLCYISSKGHRSVNTYYAQSTI